MQRSGKLELDAFVLAAGLQTRYKQKECKLLGKVEGVPAFWYVMQTLLAKFPEECIRIISSHAYEDFNSYVDDSFPDATLVFDAEPGSGSARSLVAGGPWQTEQVFVTEGNIYYLPELIRRMYELLSQHLYVLCVIGITPKLSVAPTHRKVVMKPALDLSGNIPAGSDNQVYRNMGAYMFRSSMETYIRTATSDIIQVLDDLVSRSFPVLAIPYAGPYAHTTLPNDLLQWSKHIQTSVGEHAYAQL